MPATEKTWRSLKLMHFVFGLSALAMLITTIWMLAADHNREWKKVQIQTQRIDDWQMAARIAEEKTKGFDEERARLEKQLEQQQLTPPAEALIDRFLVDALYDKYHASLVAQKGEVPQDDPIVVDYAALRAMPKSQRWDEKSLQLQAKLLKQLEKLDNTGIRAAYKDLVALTPAKSAAVATHSPSPTQPGVQPSAASAVESAKDLQATLKARQKLFDQMREVIRQIKFAEEGAATDRKSQRSLYDAAKSELDIAVRLGSPKEQRDRFQKRVDAIRDQILKLTLRYEGAKEQREKLEGLLKEATQREDLAAKNLADFESRVKKLEETLREHRKYSIVHAIQEMPILDGFSPRLKIEQIWLPKLTLNNNFRDVARFDRCITCHQQIDKTAPGSATAPAFPVLEPNPVVVELATPATRPDVAKPAAGEELTDKQFHAATQQIYGLRIAEQGMLNPADVTVEVVWPQTVAAKAGLLRGDVITHVLDGTSEVKVVSRKQVLGYLVTQVNWGKPVVLTVQRGTPHAFASHPRLDLFMGSLSPHKMQSFGCTICHQGQGSATSFKYASHTPNSLREESEWEKEYGYYQNHHWIYPMYPTRFVESSCLKCHHNVVDLQESERFPDPPAPKVMAGYQLITQMGCFGCHEITGFDGPKSIGPDIRAEPMYYAAGAALAPDVAQQIPAFAALHKQAVDAQPGADAKLAKLQGELAELKKDEGKNKAAIEELGWKIEEAAFVAGAAASLQKSLDDLATIVQSAHTIAEHPEDTPVRLRLLEYLNIDSARSGALEKLLTDPALSPEMVTLIQELQAESNDMALRGKLVVALRKAQASGEPPLRKESLELVELLSRSAVLTSAAQKLADQVKTVEGPGTFRKVGPSLRHVATKLGPGTLNRWIYNPRSIRESTKMPRFFGLHAGLTEDALQTAAMYEPIEARAMAQYLLDKSRPLADLETPASVTEPPSAERGKILFQTRGCLACHKQSETPQAESNFAPDLTGLGTKLRTKEGQKWLVSWLRDPKRYHLRTVMPNMFLEPVKLLAADGKEQKGADGRTRMSDPPQDIAAYLLGPEWKPVDDPFTTFTDGADVAASDEPKLTLAQLDEKLLGYLRTWLPEEDPAKLKQYVATGVPEDVQKRLPGNAQKLVGTLDEANKRQIARAMALDTLVQEYLLTVFPVERSRKYLHEGIPQEVLPTLKGAEVELVAPIDDTKKLTYVGRRAISKFGCTGCHDVPGFESARPIGTGLADWGRKETSKLAFEHILEFLPIEQAERIRAEQEKKAKAKGTSHAGNGHAAKEHVHLKPADWGPDGFFIEALMHEQREGFLWQKLRQPRSFDFEKTKNKTYNEWLRMPQFNLTDAQREQIMTFVLGLVSEPPAAQYVFQPDVRRTAEIQGEKALATFNCQSCHVLKTGEWKVSFAPGAISPGSDATLPPFLRRHTTPDERRASLEVDRRGLLAGTVHGMYKVNEKGHEEFSRQFNGEFKLLSELEGETIPPTAPWGYDVQAWQSSVLSGGVVYPGDPLPILSTALTPENPLINKHYRPRGGDFARLLLPIAIATQNQETAGAAAWAWGPPPLTGQGHKTQEKWLHDFLLEPYVIRPAVILRMPKFNMSSDESEVLTQYFSARDNVDYPNHYGASNTTQRLAADEAAYQKTLSEAKLTGTRFGDAEKILLSKAGCIKCHLVGNFVPVEQGERARGPNLADVYRRLKPDYVHRWIAKPNLILPYTGMPVNFPYDPADPSKDGFWDQAPGTMTPVQPYHGGSLEQIRAVSDLLSNWDRFIEGQTSIRKKVEAAAGAAPAALPANAAQPTPGE